MKKITIFITLMLTLLFTVSVMAQQKAETRMTTVKRDGNRVAMTLTSSKKFIAGGNRYILTVGDSEFKMSKQSSYKGTGSMTFFVPQADFYTLAEGADIYLTYGKILGQDGEDRAEIARENSRCWYLGKFSKKLLKK